jgi:phosphohistidine phosphatase SixA
VEVYLMRHGAAAPGQPDAARPLTPAGIAVVEAVAARAAALQPRIGHVYHSGLVRARQTAEILARALVAGALVEARVGLAPDDAVEPVADWLRALAADDAGGTVLVGHLPFLGTLIARLVGEPAGSPIAFAPGTLVQLLPHGAAGRYAVGWILTAEEV